MSTADLSPFQNGKTALITGASGGIGLALARIFARNGHALILVARNTAAMTRWADVWHQMYGTASRVVTADLTEPGAATRARRATPSSSLRPDGEPERRRPA